MGQSFKECCSNDTISSDQLEIRALTSTNSSDYIEKRAKIFNQQNESLKKQLSQSQNKINNYKNEIIEKNNVIAKLQSEIQILRNNQSKKNKFQKSKGLDNIGATCYMNATLQCLSNTRKLKEYFEKNYQNSSNKTMSNEFFKLIYHLFNTNDTKKSYSPYSFKEVLSKENPLFAGVQANDSKDLINFLLEKMHQELNVINNNIKNNNTVINQQDQTNRDLMLRIFIEEYTQKFNSPISNLFYGLLETRTQCKGCNIIKYNFQIYSFLEFPLQQVNTYFYNMGKKPLFLPNNKNPDVNLFECFEYNKKVDLMNGENQMWCNICNKLTDSLYTTELYSAPNYLIINLNRGKGAVYECNVDFPEELNIVNYLSFKNFNTVFDLYAVISHLGPSSMSGHFVAYVRNNEDYKWYLYNDSMVTECTKPFQYRDGMPYILFYRVLKGGPNLPF